MNHDSLVLGAVAYDPKVVAIWDGFQAYFQKNGLFFDYVLFTNYERQVEAHFAGQIDVAWNSPLAWIQSERIASLLGRRAEAIAMRDTDCDLASIILVRSGGRIRSIADLKGARVAVGAEDSPQATLIPLHFICGHGFDAEKDFEVLRFDRLRGKHGDHIGGEREAVRALMRGEADAACLIDGNHLLFSQEGVIQPGATRILAETPKYDHCNFTVLDGAPQELISRFRDLLLNMSYADPDVRPLLDLEGLKQWRPGRTHGYRALSEAVERF
ncbi:MAG TPA: phosphate/phosphite/phosphonate ABC transporter substrate-binding protein, partial [Bryobacteraceae bacterium]|nr:phosphate/phosphite/phosphonate ABC transporter substrate-binding protein [Bryobacteraceae bacterium]